MANTHSNLTSLFTDIANAIREKTGTTGQIVADKFPENIRGIVINNDDNNTTDIAYNTILTRNYINVQYDFSKIRPYAFMECSSIVTATFPICSSIGYSAFCNCTSLTSVSFPSCESIGSHAFAWCSSLTSIYFPLCKYIREYAFSACTSLTSVDLPLCSYISQLAFRNCKSLSTVNLSSCKFIGSMAFDYCDRLSSLCINTSTLCSLNGSNALYSTPYAGYSSYFSGHPRIYVPASLVSAYQSATNWSYYSSYFAAIESVQKPFDVPTAALYDDGSMVFYGVGESKDTSKTIINTYTGWDNTYLIDFNTPWYDDRLNIKTVSFVGNVKPISTAYWFDGCKNLTSINFTNLNTSNVTDMSNMFNWCNSLTSLDLSNFNTSNVTNMNWMFCNCNSLKSLDLSSFNTSNVTNMSNMFCFCRSLTSLDLSNFNTSKVTDMSSMFNWCDSLKYLDLSSFNTSKVTNMSRMFYDCHSLTSLDLSSFNTSKVTSMESMFNGCSYLTTIYVLDLWNTDLVNSSTNMFGNCTKLVGDISFNSDYTDKTYATTTGGYLTYKSIATAILYDDGSMVFYNNNVTPDTNKTIINTYTDWDNSKYNYSTKAPWYNDRLNIKTVSFVGNVKPISTAYWFYECENLTSIDFTNLDTSNVTDMCCIFRGCSSLISLDISSFNTSKVTNM